MKALPILVLLLLPLSAKETPVQPWSGYRVHDTTRPHPEKVTVDSIVTTAPPSDADIIFDGKNTDALTVPWTIKDGVLIANKLGNIFTKKSYGSCQLHLEWRIPAGRKVRGQKGGNSGVFLMGLYEVQIQESHTNVTYADGQAGALYAQYPPLLNASRPQGEWQSYDIIFTAPEYKDDKCIKPAIITILHNGVMIHNAQEFQGPTSHKTLTSYPKTHPKKAPLRLQWHKDPVEYRNIWIRDLSNSKQQTKTTDQAAGQK